MNIGDEVTINGMIIAVAKCRGRDVCLKVRLKSGDVITIDAEDINTVRPKIEIPEKDERRGN